MRKYGKQQGLQRYHCRGCNHFFQSKRRRSGEREHLWQQYVFKRQTVKDLSEQTGLSERQTRRWLQQVRPPPAPVSVDNERPVVLVIDTTYFYDYGVMVFRCWHRRKNLLWCFVDTETVEAYLAGIAELEQRGYRIASVTCDGKKWLPEALEQRGYPVQLCQFHVMKTVTRYLTKRPVLPAGIELRALMLTIPRTTRSVFEAALMSWLMRWAAFLKEKTTDELTGRWCYTHRRIRGAAMALRHALPRLFIFEQHPDLGIPTTTNTLDGTFSHLKQKIHVHRGLNRKTEQRMVEAILQVPTTKKNIN